MIIENDVRTHVSMRSVGPFDSLGGLGSVVGDIALAVGDKAPQLSIQLLRLGGNV